jgi:DNA-binding response OmpR family regulator
MEQKLNVLVIDDEKELRDSLRQLLEKLGCAVAVAASAETGKEELRRFRYDAVFASLCLERFGGRDMARWTQKNVSGKTKFFITTGWQGDLEPEVLRSNFINDVIRRPYNFNDLRHKVQEHLVRGSDSSATDGKREQRPDIASVK